MDDKDIAGMAFRLDLTSKGKPNLLQKAQIADFIPTRFFNRITAKQGQLWVINGPGGIFRGEVLLDTLRNIVPDFETGDLMITVDMMKKNYKIGYFRDIKALSLAPATVKELFKQRQRWDRGTGKVIFSEPGFYLKQFSARKLLAVQTLLYYLLHAGILIGAAQILTGSFADFHEMPKTFFANYAANYIFWTALNYIFAVLDSGFRKEGDALRMSKWFFLQGMVFTAIIAPARISGFYQAIKFFISGKRIGRPKPSDSSASVSSQTQSVDVLAETKTPVASSGIQTTGGIDFNARNMNVQTKGEAIDFTLPENMTVENLMNAEGFVPVIISIVPVTDFMGLLGLSSEDIESGESSKEISLESHQDGYSFSKFRNCLTTSSASFIAINMARNFATKGKLLKYPA